MRALIRRSTHCTRLTCGVKPRGRGRCDLTGRSVRSMMAGLDVPRKERFQACHGFERLRRDRHRRRPQRPHQRRLLRPRGSAHRRAGGPQQDRRRRRHERPVRRPPRHQRHDLLLRDVADAADDHPRAQAQAVRLRRHAVRPVLPGVPRRPRDHGLRRRPPEELRLDRAVLQAGRRHAAEVGGVAQGRLRRARAAAAAGAAARRLDEAGGPARARCRPRGRRASSASAASAT